VIHARIVAPPDRSARALELLRRHESVCNVVFLKGVALNPEGDVILADLAREDASVVISDLKEGSIALEDIDAYLSEFADIAVEKAKGAPSDAVVWEEVEARTSENTELSFSFLAFMVLAGPIAGVGIYLDSPILVVGAMVVGPEFGPIAGFCVAATTKRLDVAARSFWALAIGFPAAITAVWLATLLFKATGVTPDTFSEADHGLSSSIANPDFLAFFVAVCAGAAGILSLTTAKSGALIGVLISVTTIPAAANVGVAAAYGDWDSWRGSLGQLTVNLAGILMAGTLCLWLQRTLYMRRRRKHLTDPMRRAAGLPMGQSLRGTSAIDARELQKLLESDRAAE
jgi:uncharacterized hydrophobic protein (TIGR00271 family)